MLRRLPTLLVVLATGCGAGSPAPAPPPPLDVPKLPAKAGAPAQPSRPEDRQATPEDARDYAIDLLEREQYEELIVRLLAPKDLEKIKEREGGLAKIVAEFSTSEKHTELLETLRQSKTTKPETTDDGHVKFPIAGNSRGLTFELVDGRWYIRN